MRYILPILFATFTFAQPTVSSVRVDFITHSTARIRFNVSPSVDYGRVFYQAVSGFGNPYWIGDPFNFNPQNDTGITLSGLTPNTFYTCEVEASADNSTWSAPVVCPGGGFTTLTVPSPHPQPPQINALWTPVFPNTSGYAGPFSPGAGCTAPTLNSLISTAVNLQPTNGTNIVIPAGMVCPLPLFPNDTQIATVPQNSTNLNLTTGVFTGTFPANWVPSNNQQIVLSGASCLPGSFTQGNGISPNQNSYNPASGCNNNGPLWYWTPYFLVNVTPVSGSVYTFQISYTSGGAGITGYGDYGAASGPGETMMFEQWPSQNSNWIVIQTSTPDSQFCPFGVRCMGSIWQSKMATIQATGGCFGGGFGCSANNNVSGYFTHNVWFRGLELTTTDASALANSSADPEPTNNMWEFPYTWMSSNIVMDRMYIHTQPFPNRLYSAITIGGANIGFLSNDIEGMNYWRPSATPTAYSNGNVYGFSGSLTGQTVTILPGSVKLGPQNTCSSVSNITFTVTGGTASGTPYVYAAAPTCVPTMVMPIGMTGTCTGALVDSGSVSHPCSVITNASPGWLLDSAGFGGINCSTWGTFTLTNGTASSWTTGNGSANYNTSHWLTEGAQAIQSASGPGPFTFWNNYFEGSGLLWHVSGDSAIDPVGTWWRQNTFFWNLSHEMGSSTSDGYEYANRNGPEHKHGQQIKVDGNQFINCWASVSATGPCFLAHTASNNGQGTNNIFKIQDVDVTNNVFWNVNVGTEIGSNGNANATAPVPAALRLRFKNNITLTNGWTQLDGNSGPTSTGGGGNPIEIDGAVEDLIIDHNTLFQSIGVQPLTVWHSPAQFIEGCQYTNNLSFINQNPPYGITTEAGANYPGTFNSPTIGGTGKTVWNLQCTNDPGTPGGIFNSNVAVPSFFTSGPGTPTGYLTPQSVCTSFGGGTMSSAPSTVCPNGLFGIIVNSTIGTPLGNLTAVGFTNPTPVLSNVALNLQLLYSSPFKASSNLALDGTDMGADMNALMTAQGAVGTPSITSLTPTSASISLHVWDRTVACPVDYAVAPNDPSTQSLGGRVTPSASNFQSVNLTGLTANTNYFGRWLCPVNQPTFSFQTP